MGHLSPFFVKPIILQGDENAGERFPMLMHRATHLPVTRAIEWALLSRRPLVAVNTLGRNIREVGHFEHWMLTEHLSLDDPFDFADAFTPIRIQASLRPWFGRDFSDRKVRKLAVSPEHVRSRLETTLQYVDWHLREAHSSLSVRTQAKEILAFEVVRQNIKQALRDVMPTQSSKPDIEGLDDASVARVFEYIAMKGRSSPWGYGDSKRTLVLRKRNQLIVTLMLCFGIRRGDLLKLVTGDVLTHGSDPVLAVRRRPDDPRDSRLIEPNSKTQPRDLPLDPVVTRQLNDFVSEYRELIPKAKRTPYLFLEVVDGRPLSLRALNDVFEALQPEFPGIRPHICRHTHNTRLRKHCRRAGIPEKEELEHAKYLNGWLGDNSDAYTKREAREAARRLSLAVQRGLFAAIEDVPF